MRGIIVALIINIILIIYVLWVKSLPASSHEKIHPDNTEIIAEAYVDVKGNKIKGSGLTPSTTPKRRSCIQLMLKNTQETKLLKPEDL
jgi:hypothetical protein